jgi:hypothetical protein
MRQFLGEEDPAPEEPATGAPAPLYAGKGVPAYGAYNEPSIKKKFGVDESITGTAGVDAAFKELSAYIQKGGLADDATRLPEYRVIKPGDWIELEGGLTVAAYGEGGGGFSSDEADMYWNTELKWEDEEPFGKMNRLIVVGINSFYEKNGNGTTPHVVFQFQNIPVTRRMNPKVAGNDTNAGGYPASEMREYLTPVDGVDGSGNFLAGLITAGVPEGVLWGPARVMATKNAQDPKTEPIYDRLWLPTEWEMFGDLGSDKSNADSSENGTNQARLAYYATSTDRAKVAKTANGYPASLQSTSAYWLASAKKNNDATRFCSVLNEDSYPNSNASKVIGVAPAFCVQGWPQP